MSTSDQNKLQEVPLICAQFWSLLVITLIEFYLIEINLIVY